MAIILVGLNHNSAPVALRERLSLSGCGLQMALEEFHGTHILPTSVRNNGAVGKELLTEVVILSTCNRLEIYAVSSAHSAAAVDRACQAVVDFLAHLQNVPLDQLLPHLYYRADHDAIAHLLRVSAGLESMILGEPQILGQIRSAYSEAKSAGTVGSILSHLYTRALHAGKRARSETEISRFTTSISHAAARLASKQLNGLSEATALIVGAGEMAKQAASALEMHGARSITIINRTYSGAAVLAQAVGGEAAGWHQLEEKLIAADFVITATGAPHTVIHATEVANTLPRRNGRPLLFVDIAVPRDVEMAVGELPGVLCHDVDALQHTVDENMAQRLAEIPHVETIVADETKKMEEWLAQRKVVPVIVDLRAKVKAIAADEVALAQRRVRNLDAPAAKVAEDVIERLAHRLVNKFLHEPTVQLKEQAANGDEYPYAAMVRELFQLEQANRNFSSAQGDQTKDQAVAQPMDLFSAALTGSELNVLAEGGNGHG